MALNTVSSVEPGGKIRRLRLVRRSPGRRLMLISSRRLKTNRSRPLCFRGESGAMMIFGFQPLVRQLRIQRRVRGLGLSGSKYAKTLIKERGAPVRGPHCDYSLLIVALTTAALFGLRRKKRNDTTAPATNEATATRAAAPTPTTDAITIRPIVA